MIKWGISKSATDLFRDVPGCWRKYDLIVCTFCSKLGGLLRPNQFSTICRLLKFSDNVRILVHAGGSFCITFEDSS